MDTIGCHIIAELAGCNVQLLESTDAIRDIITRAAVEANAEVREVAVHKFSPQGVSGVVVIAESHLSIHTWPETGYAAVDIYTCGDKTVPRAACRYIAQKLEAEHVYQSEIKRGVPDGENRYKHQVEEIILEKIETLSSQ